MRLMATYTMDRRLEVGRQSRLIVRSWIINYGPHDFWRDVAPFEKYFGGSAVYSARKCAIRRKLQQMYPSCMDADQVIDDLEDMVDLNE